MLSKNISSFNSCILQLPDMKSVSLLALYSNASKVLSVVVVGVLLISCLCQSKNLTFTIACNFLNSLIIYIALVNFNTLLT